MFKRHIITLFGILIISLGGHCFALTDIGSDKGLNKILTNDNTQIIEPPEDHAMMRGTHTAVESEGHKITNISNTNNIILTQEEAENKTLDMIHRIINWVLGILAFVALIVVIFGGFQMVTAAGDDAKFKSGKTALKKVSIGIIGIGISWMFVSLAFWFVDVITK